MLSMRWTHRKEETDKTQLQLEQVTPVIDALNNGFSSVVNAISGEGEQTRRFQMTVDLIDKGSTKGATGSIIKSK